MDIVDSKIAILFRSFSKNEFEELENFVKSPFFNTSSQITGLFQLLKSDYPQFSTLDKKRIFNALYPKEEFKDKKIRDLFTRLLKIAEEFLAQLEFRKAELNFNRLVLKQYAERNLERHFSSKLKDAETRMNKEEHHGSNYYFERYALLRTRREYFESLKAFGKGKEFSEDFSLEIELFNDYVIFSLLTYGVHLEIHKKGFNFEYEYVMLEKLIEYLRQYPDKTDPLMNVLLHLILLAKNPNEESLYFNIRKELDSCKGIFEENDLRYIMIELFNYTKLQSLEKDKPEFRKDNYALLKESIEMGMYPKEGIFLAESSYITVCATALQEKDFEWALYFMNKYKEKLNPDIAANAFRYCMSVYEYRLGNYSEALKGFAKVSLDDFYYQLRVKNHQLKIYYETAKYESALSLIDSYRHFLSANRFLPEFVRVRFSNYVNFLSRIVNIHLGGNIANIPDIIKDIESINQSEIENKVWLLEQISKLKA